MPYTHTKVPLKSAPQTLNFVMQKLYQKVIHYNVAANALPHSCIVRHNAALFLIKTILYETNNNFIAKN